MPLTATGARKAPCTVRWKRCTCLFSRSYTPLKRGPSPSGQLIGNAWMPSTFSSSSSRSSVGRAGRSILFMKVKIGTPRRRQTSKSLRSGLDALAGVDHHHGGVHGGEHAVGVLREVLVTRRVQEVDHAVLVFELQDGGGNRDPALFFQLHPVRGGGALVLARRHAAGELQGAAVEQEFLGERGLSGVRVGNDRERTAAEEPTAVSSCEIAPPTRVARKCRESSGTSKKAAFD
jgi:hypothetical protein